ncbi:hypothetical protein [Planktothrix sp. PCC 11201]|uniref:hypothetical protein n=1 Tax=Planktothrix sp. PCC 11201 TaxID=1729650 RepID=UPI00117DE63C|nr:hypothetical protein [Planktothrix sp. PCC 11201]
MGWDEIQIYCDDLDRYFCNFDELFDHLKLNKNNSEGEVFEITIMKFKKIQYWFPDIDYILKYIAENYELPSMDEIIHNIYQQSEIEFEEFKDIETLNGQDELQRVLDSFKQSQNLETLKQALESFRGANEDFYYLVPDTNNPEIHCFVFQQDELIHLGLKEKTAK